MAADHITWIKVTTHRDNEWSDFFLQADPDGEDPILAVQYGNGRRRSFDPCERPEDRDIAVKIRALLDRFQ